MYQLHWLLTLCGCNRYIYRVLIWYTLRKRISTFIPFILLTIFSRCCVIHLWLGLCLFYKYAWSSISLKLLFMSATFLYVSILLRSWSRLINSRDLYGRLKKFINGNGSVLKILVTHRVIALHSFLYMNQLYQSTLVDLRISNLGGFFL